MIFMLKEKKKGLRKREGGSGRKKEKRKEKEEKRGREDERRRNVLNGYIEWNEEIKDFYLIILCILLGSNPVALKLHVFLCEKKKFLKEKNVNSMPH